MSTYLLTFIAIGALHALLMAAAVLLRSSSGRASGLPLALLLGDAAICTAGPGFYGLGLYHELPHLAETYVPFTFLLGPLLYVHLVPASTASLSRRRALLHASPFLLYHALLVPFYVSEASFKVYFIETALAAMPMQWKISTTLFVLHLGIYLLAAIRRLVSGHSDGEKRWPFLAAMRVQPVALLAIVVWLVLVVRTTASLDSSTFLVAPTASALAIFVIGYMLLMGFPSHFHGRRWRPSRNAPVSPALADEVEASLHRNMAEQRLFLRPELTLDELAKAVGSAPHVLSGVLNRQIGQTFADYVNAYRVDAACKILADPDLAHLTISAIALDVGFTSRSAFYEAFRKHAGVTPSEYRKKLRS